MRTIIAYEGKTLISGYHLKPGSLKWGDRPIPVMRDNNWGVLDGLLGHATDFRREEDGSITAEIGNIDIPVDRGLTAFANRLGYEYDEETKVNVVDTATVMALFLAEVPWARRE